MRYELNFDGMHHHDNLTNRNTHNNDAGSSVQCMMHKVCNTLLHRCSMETYSGAGPFPQTVCKGGELSCGTREFYHG